MICLARPTEDYIRVSTWTAPHGRQLETTIIFADRVKSRPSNELCRNPLLHVGITI
jgi:hypothetical protein